MLKLIINWEPSEIKRLIQYLECNNLDQWVKVSQYVLSLNTKYFKIRAYLLSKTISIEIRQGDIYIKKCITDTMITNLIDNLSEKYLNLTDILIQEINNER